MKISVLAPARLRPSDDYISDTSILSGGFCNAGISTLNVSPEGHVQPCSRLRVNLGNAATDSLSEIWLRSPVLAELRDRGRLRGMCGKCDKKYLCGGCRANANAEWGDYLMEDPRCADANEPTC